MSDPYHTAPTAMQQGYSKPFKDWTDADVAAHNAKKSRSKTLCSAPIPMDYGVDKEIPLHAEIMEECAKRRWIALHSNPTRKTGRVLGEWDFEIYADCGRSFLIEVKTRTGKLSKEQFALHYWAHSLGHTSHIVRSFAEFLEVVK